MSALTKGNDESNEPAADGQHEAQQATGEFFRCRPFAFLQHAVRRYKQRDRDGDKAKRSAASYVWMVSLSIAGVIFIYTWYRGWMEANTVIAIFTIVMAFTTWRNWEAMVAQNDIMIRQNDAIEKQLVHAGAAVLQTDKIIEQMRNEQRAWIGVIPPDGGPIGDSPKTYIFTLINHGRTPAAVLFRGNYDGVSSPEYATDRGRNPDSIAARIKELERQLQDDLAKAIRKENPVVVDTVPPGDFRRFQGIAISVHELDGPPEIKPFWSAGFVIYDDGAGGIRATRYQYIFDREIGGFHLDNNQNFNRME